MRFNSTRIFPVSMVWKRLYIFIFNILIPCKKPYDYIGIQQGYHAFHPSSNPIFVASLMSSFPASFFWSYSLKRNPFSLDNRRKGFYYGLFLTCAGTCRIGLLFLFYFFHRLEVEGGGVQAVAQAGGSRAVGGKMWPRWASHRLHSTSVRRMPKLMSVSSATFSLEMGW